MSRHTSAPVFFKSTSRTCVSPSVILDTGYDDPDNLPAVQVAIPPTKMSFAGHFIFFKLFISIKTYIIFLVRTDCLKPHSQL